MIISYPPGAGGNRFIYYLNGLYYKLNKRYDFLHDFGNILVVPNKWRYINVGSYPPTNYSQNTIILTHTINNVLIEKKFPGHIIYNLDIDIKKSLRRYVSLYSIDDKNNLEKFENYLDYCFSIIKWNLEYYGQYPINYNNGTVISKGHDFFEFMNSYLDNIEDKIFDLAWDIYTEQGPDAPIIDIWNNIKHEFE